MVGDGVSGRESVLDAPRGERLLELGAYELAEVHGGSAQLGAGYLEPAGYPARRGNQVLIGERTKQLPPLRHRRDHRHQVRLAGTVIADHQESLVVGRLVELKLGDQDRGELLSHLLAHHVGGHQPVRSRLVIGVTQLHHRLDRLELNQVAIGHHASSPYVTAEGTTITRPPVG